MMIREITASQSRTNSQEETTKTWDKTVIDRHEVQHFPS